MDRIVDITMDVVDKVSVGMKDPKQATIAVSAVVGIAVLLSMRPKKSSKRDGKDFDSTIGGSVRMLNNADTVLKREEVEASVDEYNNLFSGDISSKASIEGRESEYQKMINHFYNLVTDFYEWGWGQSFHFGPRWCNEEFMESIKRTEYHLCSRLGMKPGVRAIDVGCGVGGPMRHMAIFSGATIDGITINQYQVNVGNKYNRELGLDHICKLTQGDFQKLPWNDETFDVAYAIEATCHSPDKVDTFSQVNRVLKKGGLFAGYEWIVLDKYDASNPSHVSIKEGIEEGNGLPTLATAQEVVDALQKAGFEVVEYYDANRGMHDKPQIPWYATLDGSYTLKGFRMTRMGRICTHIMVNTLEFLRIAPRGSAKVSTILNKTAIALVDGGKQEIFTPSFYFLAKKL